MKKTSMKLIGKILAMILFMGLIIGGTKIGEAVEVKANQGLDGPVSDVEIIDFGEVSTSGGQVRKEVTCTGWPMDDEYVFGPSISTDLNGYSLSTSRENGKLYITLNAEAGETEVSEPLVIYYFNDNGGSVKSCTSTPAAVETVSGTESVAFMNRSQCKKASEFSGLESLDLEYSSDQNIWSVQNVGTDYYSDSYNAATMKSNFGIVRFSNLIADGTVIRVTLNSDDADYEYDVNGKYNADAGELLEGRIKIKFTRTSADPTTPTFDKDIFYSNGAMSVSGTSITYGGSLAVWPALKFGGSIPNNFKVEVRNESSSEWVRVNADNDNKFNLDPENLQVKISADGYQPTIFDLAKNSFGVTLNVRESGISWTVEATTDSPHTIRVWVLYAGAIGNASGITDSGPIGYYKMAKWVEKKYSERKEADFIGCKIAFMEKANGICNPVGLPNETKNYLVVAIAVPNDGETGNAFAYTFFSVYEKYDTYVETTYSGSNASKGKTELKKIDSSKLAGITFLTNDEAKIEKLQIAAEVLSDNTGNEIVATDAEMKDSVKGASLDSEKGVFEKGGKPVANQFVEDKDGNIYFTDENGKPLSDMIITNGDKSYYFDKDGKAVKNGVVTLENGEKMVTGNKGALKTGENKKVIIGDKEYLLKDNGYLAQGEFVTNASGKTFYAGAGGEVKTGSFKVEGVRYVTNTNGAIQKNTIATYNGDSYFCETDGSVRINKTFSWQGVTYKADKTGKLTVVR